jgi:hypothetical protein
MQYFPSPVPAPGSLEASVTANIGEYQKGITAAEERQRNNRESIYREQQARKIAADNLNEAQARLGKTRGLFDSMSHAIEGTRQAIVTTGGFGPGLPLGTPSSRVADAVANSQFGIDTWNYDQAEKQNAWMRSQGFPVADIKRPVSPMGSQTDKTKKDINDLNAMFAKIISDAGLKVNFEVKDD